MKYLKTLFWFTIGIQSYVHAQVSDTIKKWTLESCFQYALVNNIDINTTRLSELSSAEDVRAAKGSRIPNLYGTLNNYFTNSKTDISGNGDFVGQVITAGNYSLNSSLLLWNGNYIGTNIHQKELVGKTFNLMVEQSKNNLVLQITQGYLSVLLAKENLIYVKDLVATSEIRLQQGRQLYDAGSTAKTNVLQLEAQLSSDQYLQIQTENTIRQSILFLKQILQLPTAVSFDTQTPNNLNNNSLAAPLVTVQNYALENFPEIKTGQFNKDISYLSIVKAKASFLPTVTVNALIETAYNDVLHHPINGNASYFTQTANNLYQQMGITISIPVFSNRINSTNLEKAKIGFRQADFNLTNTKLILSQQVELASLNAVNAKQAYAAANKQLIAVTESYRIMNEEYKLGGVNAFDLLQQKNQYIQAVQAFTQSKYTAILEQKIYDFYNGTKIQL